MYLRDVTETQLRAERKTLRYTETRLFVANECAAGPVASPRVASVEVERGYGASKHS